MTTFVRPFNGRNLVGMDSHVLRPIITEFLLVEDELPAEAASSEGPVVAAHSRVNKER